MHECEKVSFFNGGQEFRVIILPEIKRSFAELDNFGLILPGRYRGSWPRDMNLEALTGLGINSVFTLYSSSHLEEVEKLATLAGVLKQKEIEHVIVDITDIESFFMAANLLLESTKPSYLHCAAGANRTSIVALLASLIHLKSIGEVAGKEAVERLLSEAISFGFDYDKPAERRDMLDALELAKSRGLISLGQGY